MNSVNFNQRGSTAFRTKKFLKTKQRKTKKTLKAKQKKKPRFQNINQTEGQEQN